MAKPKHYSPEIRRFLVSALYHEAQARGVPMTVLTNQIIADNLKDSHGWKMAEESLQPGEAGAPYTA